MTLSQHDFYPWTYYIFFVNKKKIKDVAELRQRIVEELEQLGQHVTNNVIRHSQWRRRLRIAANFTQIGPLLYEL